MNISDSIHIPVISWIINNRCNYRCGYCYTSGANTNRPEYSEQELRSLFSSVATVTPTTLYLSGGEPLLDKNLVSFVRNARQTRFDSIWVCSNGSLLTDGVVQELKCEGVAGFSISLDHTIPQLMDLITGSPGSHADAIGALQKVKKAGLKAQLTITLLRQNLNVIPDLIRTGMDLGVDTIEFKRYRPVAAQGEKDKFSLHPEENRRILHEIFQFAQQNRSLNFFVHDPLYGIEFYDRLEQASDLDSFQQLSQSTGCLAGNQWIGIDPFGDVAPCPLLLYTSMTIGNIRERQLSEILLASEAIAALRDTKDHEGRCKYGVLCGGCRTHARIETGDYRQKDPMCPYEDYRCPTTL